MLLHFKYIVAVLRRRRTQTASSGRPQHSSIVTVTTSDEVPSIPGPSSMPGISSLAHTVFQPDRESGHLDSTDDHPDLNTQIESPTPGRHANMTSQKETTTNTINATSNCSVEAATPPQATNTGITPQPEQIPQPEPSSSKRTAGLLSFLTSRPSMVVQDEVVFDAEMRRILLWVKTLIWILMKANLFSVAKPR